jgi:Flp pilus assembly protein TadB
VIAAAFGVAMGAALVVAVRSLVGRPTSLAELHRHLYPATTAPTSQPVEHAGGLPDRVGRRLAGTTAGERLLRPRLDDLRLLEESPTRTLGRIVVSATIGALSLPVVAALVATLTGVRVGSPLLLGLWLIGVAAVTVVAGLGDIARRADQRRAAYRQALAAYLDLVAILAAGGAGPRDALTLPAHAGRGPAFDAIRRTLDGAPLRGDTLPEALTRAGDELAFTPLAELGAKLTVAAAHGAAIRDALAAQAASLRHSVLTDIESRAQSATVRMSIPLLLVAMAVIVWIGYPALAHALASF